MGISELDCARQILEVAPRINRWLVACLREQTESASFSLPQYRLLT